MITYVLTKGEYERYRIVLVSTDVKLVAKEYAKLTNTKNFTPAFDSPTVQVWNDNKQIAEFWELSKSESKITKILSKLGRSEIMSGVTGVAHVK